MEREKREERNSEIIKMSFTKSQKEIAEIFNLSQCMVSSILRKNGIKLPKSRLNMSRLELDINYFKDIDSPKKAYWLGFICADGTINKNGSKLGIMVKDKEICEKIKKDIKSGHKISHVSSLDKRTNKEYSEYCIQITNAIFVSHIVNLGITNDKSNTLLFPNIKEEFYPYFIAGLFDGDGCICTKHTGYSCCSLISTKEVLDFIQEILLDKFGIQPQNLLRVSDKCKNVFKISWQNKKDCLLMLNYIYKGNKEMYLQRKYDKYQKLLNRK